MERWYGSREKVAQMLKENSPPPPLRAKYEAIAEGRYLEYLLSKLRKYRYEYSDDLPESNVPPTDPDYAAHRLLEAELSNPSYPRLKCRGNVIIGISLTLREIVDEEFIKESAILQRINDWKSSEFNAFKGKGKAFTTPEEIARMNTVLDATIAYIEKEYDLPPRTAPSVAPPSGISL